jgi:hypothetical protein
MAGCLSARSFRQLVRELVKGVHRVWIVDQDGEDAAVAHRQLTRVASLAGKPTGTVAMTGASCLPRRLRRPTIGSRLARFRYHARDSAVVNTDCGRSRLRGFMPA